MTNNTIPSSLISQYDGFIVDLWGVVHDGTHPYPRVMEVMQALKTANKRAVFLSNAPRRAAKATAKLDDLGIDASHYVRLITSGEIAFEQLQSGAISYGKHYYYLGPGKDEDILDKLSGFTQLEDATQANFILNTGYEADFQPHEEVLPVLRKLHALHLPLICVNPDLEVVKQDGTHMLCAGSVAAAYEAIGGEVVYIGKPHKAVYEAAIQALAPAKKLLAIGDNPLTDILGANKMGIDSLLITGGVLTHHHGPLTEAQARALCAESGVTPTYVADSFANGMLG